MKHLIAVIIALVVSAQAVDSSAQTVTEGCMAEKFKVCPSFRTNRSIGDYTTMIDAQGYTRSQGSWKIFVSYGPPESCAKISLYVDLGPFEADRQYERVFRGGGGVISDSGRFLHRTGEVESGLRVHNASCQVPDLESEEPGAAGDQREVLDEERERLELEQERERLALEEEQERLTFEEEKARLVLELERLAVEEERQGMEERARLAQDLKGRKQEWERQRLERERQLHEPILENLRAQKRRLAAQRREQEPERLVVEQKPKQQSGSALAVLGVLGGIVDGLSQRRGGGTPVRNLFETLGRMEGAESMSSGGTGTVTGSCARAQQRIKQRLSSASQSMSGMGMCRTARLYVSTLEGVRGELASAACPAQVVSAYDQAIAQGKQAARASCN